MEFLIRDITAKSSQHWGSALEQHSDAYTKGEGIPTLIVTRDGEATRSPRVASGCTSPAEPVPRRLNLSCSADGPGSPAQTQLTPTLPSISAPPVQQEQP